MVFPTEMLVDSVRVYQRDGETNVGCNPPDYPTQDYINNHTIRYSSVFLAFVHRLPSPCSLNSCPDTKITQ